MCDEQVAGVPTAQGIQLPPIPLGKVIAERRIVLYEADGREREVFVRLGLPVITSDYDVYRCPAQIVGLSNDERVVAPAGLDAFEAIYNALSLIGQQLDFRAEQLNLRIPCKRDESRSLSWIWKYPQ